MKTASGTCCRLEQLAVTGRQLRPVGVPPGKEMGNMLRRLLEEVMEGRLENQRDPLLDRARVLWEGRSAEKKEEREDSFFGISMEKGGE